jgi:hypothetical protein
VRDKQDDDLPSIVREIREQTEDLIRLFDQIYLRLCGIRWEEDIEHAAERRMWPLLKRGSASQR